MTSSPTIAKPAMPETTPPRPSAWSAVVLMHTAIEVLRSVVILVTLALLIVFLTGGAAQLIINVQAESGGNVDGLLPDTSAMYDAWQTHETSLRNEHIPATLWTTLAGLSLGIGIGVFLAAIMDLIAPLRWILYPLLVISQTIPIFAVAVLLVILFGFDYGPRIIVVALFCFFPVTINTLSGLQRVDPVHTSLLRAMGANRLQIWWKVRLPTAMPSFFSGTRIAATYSVVGAVIGEYVGTGSGLGKFLQRSYRSFDTDQTYLAIVIIAGLSLLLVTLSSLLEVLVLRWRYAGAMNSNRFVQFLTTIRSQFNRRPTS